MAVHFSANLVLCTLRAVKWQKSCDQVDRRSNRQHKQQQSNFYKKSQQTHRLPIERIRFRRLEARTGTAFTAVPQTRGPFINQPTSEGNTLRTTIISLEQKS
jgi:hypothetical protein